MSVRVSIRLIGLCLIISLLNGRMSVAQIGVGGGAGGVGVGGIRIDAEGLVSALVPLK